MAEGVDRGAVLEDGCAMASSSRLSLEFSFSNSAILFFSCSFCFRSSRSSRCRRPFSCSTHSFSRSRRSFSRCRRSICLRCLSKRAEKRRENG